MKKVKMYSYLIKPTKTQKKLIQDVFKKVTIVHNQFVLDKNKNKDMHRLAKDILKEYKTLHPELHSTDSSALINKLFKLGDNINKNLKTKKKCNSYTTSKLRYGDSFNLIGDYLYLPKVGNVKITLHRPLPIDYNPVSVTISEDKTGTYYASITIEKYETDKKVEIDFDKSIGLDYSSPHFYVDSKGNKADMLPFYRKQEARLDELRRKLSKQEYRSENYFKVKNKLDKVSKRVANQRKDWLHKTTTKLVNDYDVICLETLKMEDIAHYGSLSKATYDNAYGLFQKMLEYKAIDKHKKIVHVDQWYPSSKICHVCGRINKDLKLTDREWICPSCHTKLDRDLNAAINLENEGKRALLAKG